MPDLLKSGTLAVVPLRAGSRGLPGKNIRLLAGKPLYQHAVEQAMRVAGNCVISTDIEEVLTAEQPSGCQAMPRPAHLAEDQTPMAAVLLDLFRSIRSLPDIAILLQATSPLRNDGDVMQAITKFRQGNHDLVMSVAKAEPDVWKHGTIRDGAFCAIADPAYCFGNRQQLPDIYKPNGAVYVFSPERFLASGGFPASRIAVVEMPRSRSLDIDCEDDLAIAETALILANGREPLRGAA